MAFTAWCKPQEAIGFSLVLRAVEMFGNPNVELPSAPPLYFFSEPENCRNALMRCGFVNPSIQIVNQTWELRSPDELFEAFLKGTARTAGLLKRQSPKQLAAIQKVIHNSVIEYMRHKKIILPMRALVAYGTKA